MFLCIIVVLRMSLTTSNLSQTLYSFGMWNFFSQSSLCSLPGWYTLHFIFFHSISQKFGFIQLRIRWYIDGIQILKCFNEDKVNFSVALIQNPLNEAEQSVDFPSKCRKSTRTKKLKTFTFFHLIWPNQYLCVCPTEKEMVSKLYLFQQQIKYKKSLIIQKKQGTALQQRRMCQCLN